MLAAFPSDLTNHVVLLAGATGELGGAFARLVLEHGGKVAAAVRKPWQIEAVRSALGNQRVLVGVVGSTDGEAAAGFVKGACDALGPITAYVSTAGSYRAVPVGKDQANDLQEQLEANLLSSANLARAVLARLRQRRGSMTFVGSLAAIELDAAGDSPAVHYLASKAALHAYVCALAAQERHNGLRIGAILPGTLATVANRKAMPTADTSQWISLERVCAALASHAFGPTSPSAPLLPLRS
jgi:NAD(P)-dependent dehydrogenase (short-subunit alcohol dehydrogenase family)